ncbi:UNVERIFIED_CONTAM: hypothetical protein NCL1_36547 [Trichonephila clavipes]
MDANSAHGTHRKSDLPTWQVINRVGDSCDDTWRRWYPYATLIHRENGSESMDTLAERLEKSMECYDPVIILRCFPLGHLISSWLSFGYVVRDIASFLSLSSLVVTNFRKGRIPQALAATGLVLQMMHCGLWGRERLSNYSVQPKNKLSVQESSREISEVILVRKPSTGNCLLRAAVTLSAVGVCAYFFYEDYVS